MNALHTKTCNFPSTCHTRPISFVVCGCRPQSPLCGVRMSSRFLRSKSVLKARGDGDKSVDEVFQKGNEFMDKATDYVPSAVPRPFAKIGVALAGGLVLLWLFRTVLQVFSFVVFLAIIGGIGYFLTQSQRKDSKTIDVDKIDDPISEAERIMNKYR